MPSAVSLNRASEPRKAEATPVGDQTHPHAEHPCANGKVAPVGSLEEGGDGPDCREEAPQSEEGHADASPTKLGPSQVHYERPLGGIRMLLATVRDLQQPPPV